MQKHRQNQENLELTLVQNQVFTREFFKLFACWLIFHAFVVVCWLFSRLTFQKNISGTLSDRDWRSVGSDLGPNRLQRLSADDKVAASKERVITRCSDQPTLKFNQIVLSSPYQSIWYLNVNDTPVSILKKILSVHQWNAIQVAFRWWADCGPILYSDWTVRFPFSTVPLLPFIALFLVRLSSKNL